MAILSMSSVFAMNEGKVPSYKPHFWLSDQLILSFAFQGSAKR